MADALVFPSEYEGFGAPVVEAMALGTPVICADQPALVEVVGDAGLVLPRDADAWADALDVVAATRADDGRAPAVHAPARSRQRVRVRHSPARTNSRSRAEHGVTRTSGPARLVVLCPHFDPDTAPTGVVMSRIVAELTSLGHEVHVVTALPWYRNHAIEPSWGGSWVRRETTPWGSISRVHPFPGDDKTNLARRAVGFLGYTVLAGLEALRIGRPLSRVDAVIAMSPPITLGLTGWLVSRLRRGSMIFNIQDVFPDAAIETGAITNRWIISAAKAVESASYSVADAVTVLSDDLADNVRAKMKAGGIEVGFTRSCARDPELRRHRCHHAVRAPDPVPHANSVSAMARSCCTPATSASRSRSICSSTQRKRCPR